MEQVTEEKPAKQRSKSSKSADNGCLKKIDADTAKLLKQIKDKANKKQFGRNVRDSEVLSMAVGMITDAEIKLLQEATYSEKDRLHIAHSEYVSAGTARSPWMTLLESSCGAKFSQNIN
jgi:hypothetical protein